VGAHAVVDAPAGEDDLGVIANGDGLVGEVVGVDADAAGAVGAGGDDLAVEGVDDGGDVRAGAAGEGRRAAASSAGVVSRVLSRPAWSSAMRSGLMSKPITGRCLPNSTARGRPT